MQITTSFFPSLIVTRIPGIERSAKSYLGVWAPACAQPFWSKERSVIRVYGHFDVSGLTGTNQHLGFINIGDQRSNAALESVTNDAGVG